ncbi:MAG: galactokinase [Bacteroidota bacterium]
MNWKDTIEKNEVIIESPGRINLIGEHLDYNGGLVLPAAIDLKVTLFFRKNSTQVCHIYSKNYGDGFSIDLRKIAISESEWHNYFLGVIHFISQKYPDRIGGFDCVVDSSLPIGSGVSSSAALECGIAKGISLLFNIGLDNSEIITMSRDAEHYFVGTKCGIMDQFAVVMGKENKLIQLDCHTQNFKYVPATLAPYEIVLLNSNVSHNLATSEYNLRRQEAESGFQTIRKRYPNYEALTHVPLRVIEEFQGELSEVVFKRIGYVAKENSRTLLASECLENGDLQKFGALLFQSHDGLRNEYEVSCPELDFLVDFAKGFNGVLGSRMMGGGFGGCTLNLVHTDKGDKFIQEASAAYKKKFNIALSPFKVSIGDGVKRR